MNEPVSTCPHCVHCPTCGRVNTPGVTIYPSYPWTQPLPYITYGTTTTSTLATIN